jgi:trans-2,3-dihydro-3-hydroxyanthranilate isomerase
LISKGVPEGPLFHGRPHVLEFFSSLLEKFPCENDAILRLLFAISQGSLAAITRDSGLGTICFCIAGSGVLIFFRAVDILVAPEDFMKKEPRCLAMSQWDVFSANPLEGNSLAVFSDARGLSDAEMQAIAKEMNLSETTFILPRDPAIEAERGVRVRIFTVHEELPFAGHPTLGTAFALRGVSAAKEITLDLNVGKVPIQFEDKDGEPPFGEMRQVDPKFGVQHAREAVAQATGVPLEDFDPALPIQTVSTGLPFTVTPLRSLAAIQNLKVDLQRAGEYLEKSGGKFLYFVTRETVDPAATLHARMFFYNGEDPATGSAGGCTAAWMVMHGVAPPDRRVQIEQGIEMRRPSRIFVRASFHENHHENLHTNRDDNRIVNVRVGGHAVEVLRGEVFL